MLLAEATPPPWRLWRFLEQMALQGTSWHRGPDELSVSTGPARARLVAMGDVALTRPLGPDARAVFGELCDVLEGADLRTANLEAALTSRTRQAGTIGSFIRTDPANVALLRHVGLDVMTVANNHILDFGHEALSETLTVLDGAGIGACGVGSGVPRANLVVRDLSGMRVGFVGFCDDHYGLIDPSGPRPAEGSRETIAATVTAARAHVDFLVCHAHWGYEFSLHPMARHRNLAHLMLDHGADLVLCHHAHVPAGVEIRGRGVIAYGLGNAVMPIGDYMRAGHPWTNRSFLLEVSVAERAVRSVRLHPFGIASDGRMHRLDAPARRAVLAGIARMSSRLRDAEFLARLERCRIAFEGHALLNALADSARGHPRALQERLMGLRVLRQRLLIDDLAQQPALAPAAGALRTLAADPGGPESAVERYAKLAPAFAAAPPALRAAYRWQDALRSRIP